MTFADGTYRFGENHMLFGNDIYRGHITLGMGADNCSMLRDDFRMTIKRRP